MKIYLAWQKTSNPEITHIRRYDAHDVDKFLGFQTQSEEAKKWLEDNGNPQWPNVRQQFFDYVPAAEPFEGT